MNPDEIMIFGMSLTVFMQKTVFLAVVVVIAHYVDKFASRGLRRLLDVSDVPSASMFVNIVRVLIWVVALAVVLQPVFGIEPNAVITALGVTGVAISLGVQDTVSNFIGGLFLMVGKAVSIGDNVTVGSITGRVSDIDLRSTTVELRGGNKEIIPNSVLNKESLAKIAPSNVGSCSVTIYVKPEADLAAITEEIKRLAAAAVGENLDPAYPVSVLFNGFDAYGTKGTIWVHVKDDVVFATAQDAVTRALQGQPWLASALPS